MSASRTSLGSYRVGDRVQTHPATDRWMMGDRFGQISGITSRTMHVRLDRSGQTIRIPHADVDSLLLGSV